MGKRKYKIIFYGIQPRPRELWNNFQLKIIQSAQRIPKGLLAKTLKTQAASKIITTNAMLHNNTFALRGGYKSLKLVSESFLGIYYVLEYKFRVICAVHPGKNLRLIVFFRIPRECFVQSSNSL